MSGIINSVNSKSGIIGRKPNTPFLAVKATGNHNGIANNTATQITSMTTVVKDTHGGWSSNAYYIPAGYSGAYTITGEFEYYSSTNDMSVCNIQIWKNGSMHLERYSYVSYNNGYTYHDTRHYTCNIRLVDNAVGGTDRYDLRAYHVSNSSHTSDVRVANFQIIREE